MSELLPVSNDVKIRRRVQVTFTEPTLTKQSFKDESDVNKIVAKYKKTGDPSLLMKRTSHVYADVSDVPSYQDALEVVRQAEETFMALPSAVRSRFNNNPAELLDFISKKENIEEGIKLGLLARKNQGGDTQSSKDGDTPPESKAKGLPGDSK